ncbi:MAG: hypothetical protein U1C12_00225 [Patescibacteria group bacterium]|nr:hypothetical protein [Patescibacteria group bacterium]
MIPVLLAALNSCAIVPVRPYRVVTSGFGFYQVGVTVRVVNNCAPLLDLERVDGVEVKGLPYGSSASIQMVSTPFSGNNRQMSLMAKGYGLNLEYLGSITKIFHVSTSQGSREEIWEVDRLRLPGGRGGCK